MSFIKKEPVLSAAAVLAVLSMFFVAPSPEYLSYIDFRTLALLFSLMTVVAGLKEIGLFRYLGSSLARRNAFHSPACLHPDSTLLFLQHADHERRVPDHICPVFHPDPQYGWTSGTHDPRDRPSDHRREPRQYGNTHRESTEPVSLLFLWSLCRCSLWDTCCR